MLRRVLGLLAFFLALSPCHEALAQFDLTLPEPRVLLHQADSALRAVESASYDAEAFTLGTMRFRDGFVSISPAHGHVTLQKLGQADSVGAKLAVGGPGAAVRTAYDGQHIRKLDTNRKVVYVNEPDETGRMLLSNSHHLMDLFLRTEPLREELAADSLRYDGVAVIGGVLCDIVHVAYPDTAMERSAWWFFGMDDHLPRKVMRLRREADDQDRGTVLTLSDLTVNSPVDASAFVIKAPEDYEVKVYQGFGGREPTFAVGDAASAWTLSDPQGTTWSLAGLAGKIVVMDFWATWCGPCIAAMPEVQKLHERFAERGVAVLGINTWEFEDPLAFMQANGFTYPLLIEGDPVARAYDVSGIPALYVIGPDGAFLHVHGDEEDDFEALATMIDQKLKEQGK